MLKKGIIDFHTHAFPDAIAPKAISALEQGCGEKAHLDGTVAGLLRSMDANGIEKAVIANIATKPAQFEPIMKWSDQIRSERIIPFASVHPDDPQRLENISRITQAGFKGIKLHPYYQNFLIDEPRMYEMYARIEELGLICLVHTGFDIAFERIKRADPARIAKIGTDFPNLKFISTHLGAWEDWDDTKRLLLGKPIYIEISLSLEFLNTEKAKEMLSLHPPEYLLFGSDSPWGDQKNALEMLGNLGFDEKFYELILRNNALKLLGQ